MDLQDYEYLGVALTDWLFAAGNGLTLAIVLLIARRLIVGRFVRLAKKTSNVVDDLIALLVKKTRAYTFGALGIGLAFLVRQFPESITDIAFRIIFIILLWQVGVWGRTAISWWVDLYQQRRMSEDPGSVTTIRGIALLASIVLWSVLFLLILENFGVDVTALVTGLGIGGIAVALAVQNILGDLFASLSIMLDKPFVIGDFLIIGDYMGSVEDIGLKTTRLRSLSGEQIIISNSDLLKSRIRNYKRMNQRRISFSVGVVYETPLDKLERIPSMLRDAVEKQENSRFDRAHFKSLGDFALVFEVVYFVLMADYTLYMDIQQNINLEIVKQFEREGIAIAYPTQKLLIDTEEDGLALN